MLSKPGCHLCGDAREVVDQVRAELSPRISTAFKEVNILSDPDLTLLHSEDIPVLLVNGKQHAIWRVDPDRLTAAIEKAAKPRLFSR